MFLEELYILEQKGDSCDEDLEIINTLGRDKTSWLEEVVGVQKDEVGVFHLPAERWGHGGFHLGGLWVREAWKQGFTDAVEKGYRCREVGCCFGYVGKWKLWVLIGFLLYIVVKMQKEILYKWCILASSHKSSLLEVGVTEKLTALLFHPFTF